MSEIPGFTCPTAQFLPHQIRLESPAKIENTDASNRIIGSLVGLALGDALGASTEFRPRQYLVDNPVRDLQGGGTWGLQAGQWTDDTSMALCLASSLIIRRSFDPYDQLVRYKWWYQQGYLSSTGQCFDIGASSRAALEEFIQRQNSLKKKTGNIDVDRLTFDQVKTFENFNVFCGQRDFAGNGPLMRLAPIPLFFHRQPSLAVQMAGESARLTHGDPRAIDSCRYYAALIVAAIHGESKKTLLDGQFYEKHRDWFGNQSLNEEVLNVARGSYKNKKRGYDDGIRGKNFIVNTLEAALWAFENDETSFEKGACDAVNLGDDTDTTAAVYGQLAGASYGFSRLNPRWTEKLYAKDLIMKTALWLSVGGTQNVIHPLPANYYQTSVTTERPPAPVTKPKQDKVGYNPPNLNYRDTMDGKKLEPSQLPPAGGKPRGPVYK